MATTGQSSNPAVHNFLAHFQKGGARPNRFKVFITFPTGTPDALSNGELLSFTCKASKIPEGTMGVCEAAYMGRKIKLAGDRTIEDWNVTVYNDTQFKTRDAFVWWQEKILGMSTNLAAQGWEAPVTYFGQAEVLQYDREDTILKRYIVDGIFPTTVDPIELDWETNDTLETFGVTFAVNEWRDPSITESNNATSLTS